MRLFFNLLITIIVFLIFGCSKDEPVTPADKILQPISEISLSSFLSEPSGIVYNSKNNSLFVVSDALKKIFELDLSGNLIRSIDINAGDLEGVTLSLTEDTIFVVEESESKISSFTLTGIKINSFTKNVATRSSNGLEGITIDNSGYLYVVNEKSPRYLIKILNEVEVSRKEIIVVDDLSDICYDPILDCLWLISDESKKIVKMSKDGILQSEWNIPFNKGEGITFNQDKMYIVNDDNSKLYIFNKP
jgi:uncharacterized protein YjiK